MSVPLLAVAADQKFGGIVAPATSLQTYGGGTPSESSLQQFTGGEAPAVSVLQKFSNTPVTPVTGTGLQKFGAGYDDAKTKGNAMAGSNKEKMGTKSFVNDKLYAPLSDSSVKMTTLDGLTSFSATTGVAASAPFMQLLILPSGTGDLDVRIGQDMTGSGKLTLTVNLSAAGLRASGVCANGFISCNAGTWGGCRAYTWTSNDDGLLSYVMAPVSDMGGCYCINSSCGNNTIIAGTTDLVLKDLGGGAVGGIHIKDASIIISSVSSDPVTATYYGRKVQKVIDTKKAAPVAAVPTKASSLPEQSYWGNSPALTAASSSAATNDANNKDTMYYKITNSASSLKGASMKTCTIKRNVRMVTDPAGLFEGGGPAQLCTDHLIWMKIKETGNQQYDLLFVDTGPQGMGNMHNNCATQPTKKAEADGWYLEQRINLPAEGRDAQNILVKAVYGMKNINGDGCIAGGSASIDAMVTKFGTAVATSAPCPANGAQYPTYDWYYSFEYARDTIEESVNDLCAGLAMKNECAPQAEEVDGVQTKRDFRATGLSPLKSIREFKGAGPVMAIARDWWDKKRTYVCVEEAGFNFDATKERYKKIISTTKNNTTSIDYSDIQQTATGIWDAKTGKIMMPGVDNPGTCENVCKVSAEQTDTQVGAERSGEAVQVSDRRLPGTKNETTIALYKTCIDNGTTCPLSPGETKIVDCSCINEFATAAATMQMLRLGGSDQICSNGTPSSK